MIPRQISDKIKSLSEKFPIITLTGPRQSGKTTLLKYLFPKFTYVSLETPDSRLFAQDDPQGFLKTYQSPVILDEIQHSPQLFSYLQTLSDETNKPGRFILSGSQNFLLLEKISQSLAGRTAIVNLLPFGLLELKKKNTLFQDFNGFIFKGSYPRVWDKNISPSDWYPSYIQTYLEKDVRQIKQITNLSLFQKFLKLCAGRTGQILNLSSFSSDLGINHNTVRSWLSILETSFIIFFLKPYFKNIGKRLVKSSKMYFYDLGLVCNLLGITSSKQIVNYPLKGALFETLIVSEIQKYYYHQGITPQHYFLKDKQGFEIDYLIPQDNCFKAIEIKASQTINDQFFKNFYYWQKLDLIKPKSSYLIYGGDKNEQRQAGQVFSWQKFNEVLE